MYCPLGDTIGFDAPNAPGEGPSDSQCGCETGATSGRDHSTTAIAATPMAATSAAASRGIPA